MIESKEIDALPKINITDALLKGKCKPEHIADAEKFM